MAPGVPILSGYRIVANVGDQDGDLSGGLTSAIFKYPNPFYFVS